MAIAEKLITKMRTAAKWKILNENDTHEKLMFCYAQSENFFFFSNYVKII